MTELTTGSQKFDEYLKRTIWKGIRNKDFKKLLFVNFIYTSGFDNNYRRRVIKRVKKKGLPVRAANIVFSLKPEDIQILINCSRRTAYDYINTLRWFHM
jgi:hypothetical protein